MIGRVGRRLAGRPNCHHTLHRASVLRYSWWGSAGKTMAANQRIEDYALISNCATAALVGRDGSIDWLCLPRFDSGACFAALLGEPGHGRWLIAPAAALISTQRRYRGTTLILETEFETAEGAVRVIDFMPLSESRWDVVR